ncbi:general transcriptional corepressor trfA-like [Frankliniella occidentalis]|uniref:General transcriptional corepressor trfA-like n=1 Tax=Frankliniella occidentalis TaxID=133901 RepID=A0A9C6X7H4_FRAOC|nr:general transcriptional corepressor trfA-like [Frankliniella occidentalis]XP_052130488.1 general transcriptional corepressor trfA-like [Frankliniella occidentalis]
MLAALCVVMKIVEMTTGAGAGKGAADGPQDTVRCPPQPAAPPRSLTNNLNKNNNNSSKNVVNDKLLFRNMSKNNNKNNEWGECRRNNLNKRVNNVNNVWRTQHRMLEWHRRKRHKQEDKKRKGNLTRLSTAQLTSDFKIRIFFGKK